MPFSKLDSCVWGVSSVRSTWTFGGDGYIYIYFFFREDGVPLSKRESRYYADTSQNFPSQASAVGTTVLEGMQHNGSERDSYCTSAA